MPKRYGRAFRRTICDRLVAGERVAELSRETAVSPATFSQRCTAPHRRRTPLWFLTFSILKRRYSGIVVGTVRGLPDHRAIPRGNCLRAHAQLSCLSA
jgi:hypothetical protein